MRGRLRWKILLLTVLPPVVLAVATLWMVNRSLSREVQSNIHDSLRRSSLVFENMLEERAEGLVIKARVVVRDPRFFSVLTLPGSSADPRLRATVHGVAHDFCVTARTELFDVLDRQGRLLASVGRTSSSAAARDSLVRLALGGKAVSGILVDRRETFQVTLTPIYADRRLVGVLLLGEGMSESLARELRILTHSEVTFVSGAITKGSTLDDPADRRVLLGAIEHLAPRPSAVPGMAPVEILEVRGGSEKYLTLVRRIPHSDPGGRQFYAMQRSISAETAFLHGIRGGLLQLGVLAVVAALLTGFVISERITRPLRRLVRGAEEMERGNYQFPLEVQSHDEIGYLADKFKEMRQRELAYVNSLQEVARLKSEFISVASHELRTPISIIKGFHDLFAAGSLGPVTEQQHHALGAIERSLAGLIHVAESAMRVAQIEGERLVLSISEQSVAAIVEQGVIDATNDAPSRILTVTIEVEPNLPPARFDGVRLAQAIGNLVRNGIRFTPDGGYVDVSARRDGDQLVVRVRDTGVGISEEHRQDLFSRSFMVRNSLNHHSSTTLEFGSEGMGLGLSIVRGIVEAHRGTIAVESRVGEGSTFTLRVPYDCSPRLEEAA